MGKEKLSAGIVEANHFVNTTSSNGSVGPAKELLIVIMGCKDIIANNAGEGRFVSITRKELYVKNVAVLDYVNTDDKGKTV
jgi:hypothetical protein